MLVRTTPRSAERAQADRTPADGAPARRPAAWRALVGAVALAFAPLLLVSVSAAPAHACTCQVGKFAKQLKDAELVMVARVERVVPASEVPSPSTSAPATTASPTTSSTATTATSAPSGSAAPSPTDGVSSAPSAETLQVVATRVFKGELESSRTRVTSFGGGSCSWYDPAVDERLLFVVRDGQASLCSGSQPVSANVMATVRKQLGSGQKMPPPPPAEAVRTKVEDSPPREFTRLAAPGAAMALLGLLGLAVVRGVSRS